MTNSEIGANFDGSPGSTRNASLRFGHSSFVIPSSFVIRHSDFGLSPPSLLRAQIECRSGILRRPRVPAALDAWHPGQFLPFERTVHGATRQRPARAGFLVFERSGLRRDVVGVESQFAIAELRVESDRGACRLIPEHD